MEADLRRFYGVSALTLNWAQIGWLVRHLPREAALAGFDGWTQGDLLQSDMFLVKTGQRHPEDPRVKHQDRLLRARLQVGAVRAERRRKRLGISGSVLRRGRGVTP